LVTELDIGEQGQSKQHEKVHLQFELFGIRFLKLLKLLDDLIVAEKLLIEIGFAKQDLFESRAVVDHVAECLQHLLDLEFTESDPISGEEALEDLDEILVRILAVESINYEVLSMLLQHHRCRGRLLQGQEYSELSIEDLEYQGEVALLRRSVLILVNGSIIVIAVTIIIIPLVIVVSLIFLLNRIITYYLLLQEIQINLLDIMLLQQVYVHATDGLRDSLLQLHQAHCRVKVGCTFTS